MKRTTRKDGKPDRRADLTSDAEIESALALIEDGLPVAVAAASIGLTRQAFYMRAKREPAFAAEVRKRKARAVIRLRNLMQEAAATKGAWQAYAWQLERWHGAMDPLARERAKTIREARKNPGASDAATLLATVDAMRRSMRPEAEDE